MDKVLVTGATGLMGANVCEDLRQQGRSVRAIVRTLNTSDTRALEELGVEIVQGDISDMDGVLKATEGVDSVIHCAAMLGGAKATYDEGYLSNIMGTVSVLTAAARVGGIPVVQVITTPFFDCNGKTLTEETKLDLKLTHADPYALSKRLGYTEGVVRVLAGQDIRFVIPGAIYGPSPCVNRAVNFTGFNARMLQAIRGSLKTFPAMMSTYVYSKDTSEIAIKALDMGKAGRTYIAHGDPNDDMFVADWCNLVSEMVGSPHRVRSITREQSYDPAIIEEFGEGNTMLRMAREPYATPISDTTITQRELGVKPTTLAEGLPRTIEWLREVGELPR